MNAPGGGGAAIAGIEPQVRPGAWSWDEFSPLREVVVGDATGSRVPPMDRSAWLTCYPELTVAELASIEERSTPTYLQTVAPRGLATSQRRAHLKPFSFL